MSEQVNNEAPKRKLRTKEEIEAAKANGTYKPRTKKVVTVTEKVTAEEQNEEKTYQKPTLPPEQSVLIMSCLNPTVAQVATEAARSAGVEVVVLEDRVIKDYLDAKKETANKENLGQFLEDTSNRLQAEKNLVTLWAILTGNAPIEQAADRIFTRTEITRKTKLSHRQAADVLMSLRIFGMIELIKGDYEFKFIFSKKRCHDTIKTEILAMCNAINNDILRFKKSIEADNDLTKDQKKEMYEELQRAVDETIEY